MTWWRRVLRRGRLEDQLDAELRDHLERRAADLVRAGLSQSAAQRQARLEFGGLDSVKEDCRDVRGTRWVDELGQDLRYGLRMLAHSPSFTLVAVLSLTLGIGASTAIFSVVDGVLLRPTPVADLDRVVMLWETDGNTGTRREPASIPDYLDLQRDSRSFSRIGGVIGTEVAFAPPQGEPARLAALVVSHGLLPMLGVTPIAGRGFSPPEDAAKGPAVAMISESLWTRAFGRDPAVLGGTIRLDEIERTIVGVMPDRADFGMLQILDAADYSRGYADRGDRATADVWLPLQPDPQTLPRSTHPVLLLARLAPSVSVGAAQAEVTSLMARLERAFPENRARGAHVEPLGSVVFGPVRPALLVLWTAVGLVLVVACANVASLLLARGRSRAREVAVRLAIGAGRWRLARQFLAEGLVMTLTSALLGLGLAAFGVRALRTLAPPTVPRLEDVSIDVRVLALTLAVALATGVVFTLVPLLQAQRVAPHTTLRVDTGQASAGRTRRRAQGVFVAVEMALAVVLVIGASLLARSFWAVLQVDSGFRAHGVLKAEYQLPGTRYPTDFKRWPNWSEIHAFNARLLQRAAQLPGVDAVAIAGNHPLDPGFTTSFQVVGRETESTTWPELSIRSVSPGYFRVTGLRLLDGRLLRDADTTSSAPVILINAAIAARFFDKRQPIGQRIRFWGTERTIVGVVANEKFKGITAADPLGAYVPLSQVPSGYGVLLVRTQGDPRGLQAAVEHAVRDVDRSLAVFGVETLEETVGRSLGQRRFAMVLLVIFAGVALVLAVIGVHGVLTHLVTERRRELGIRAALGAPAGRIARLVVVQGLVLAAVGIGAGLVIALASTRMLSSLLFGVAPTDPHTFAMVAAGLCLVAAIATYGPARRAVRLDPAVLLKEEV
jgi:predicted permease